MLLIYQILEDIINYTSKLTFNDDNWYIPQFVKITSINSGITKLLVSVDNGYYETTDDNYRKANIGVKILNVAVNI